jgi:hypothetical protein
MVGEGPRAEPWAKYFPSRGDGKFGELQAGRQANLGVFFLVCNFWGWGYGIVLRCEGFCFGCDLRLADIVGRIRESNAYKLE